MSPPLPATKQEPVPEPSPEPISATTAVTTTTVPVLKRSRQRGPPTKHSDTTSRYSISQDNDRLYKLREEQGKTWQEISEVFKKEGRGNLTTNVIRVRFYRLKDKAVVWGDDEIERLKAAIEDVDRRKWELVSAKMAELGGPDGRKFPAAVCERKAKGI
ncbi:hypothetical protein HOY80DRAFT_893382 [Tuber brumale]|nr:hypothetical protein HOY80DRAFT_893382 [Tuber brumale]